jgi:hypothetical protein
MAPDAMSYFGSYETLTVEAVAIAAAVRPAKMLKNFILADWSLFDCWRRMGFVR